ncbi:MAG TPA: Hint domain-containing protein [Bradyrhizobium sp.]
MGASGYSVAEQQPLILKGTGLSVADADGGNGVETLTLKVSEGTLNVYPLNTGVTVQSGNNSSELVVTGTITQLQDLLGPLGSSLSGAGSNLSYDDDTNTPTSVALTLSLDDNGFTGLNGPLTAMASTTIDITPCYCAGTLIETQNGEVPVDMLKIGELIRTASGTLRPIRWIGRRSYSGRYIIGRKDILPICIRAGALDENVPRRDLWISPHHAMYLDGVLIEAKDLVNESSVVQAERVAAIEYFHIELETHDVIIAEGALSETFVDDDNRGAFHNAHDYAALYSESEHTPARYCAPRLENGYEVETVRRRIARRAGIECGSKIGAVHGFIDLVSPDCIAGWAQNPDHPEAPVCLDIFAQGELIGQVLANTYRDDLEQAGMGSGRHAFTFMPPNGTAFAPDAVEVRRSIDGALLRPRRYRLSPGRHLQDGRQ